MSQKTQKATVSRVISASVHVNNAEDTERAYAISANAYFDGGACGQVTDGTVTRLDTDGAGGDNPEADTRLASFHTYRPSGGELSISFASATGRAPLMEAVEEFITSLCALSL